MRGGFQGVAEGAIVSGRGASRVKYVHFWQRGILAHGVGDLQTRCGIVVE